MKCSVYIATSADGYIATAEGSVDWLHSAGNREADMSNNPDMGFNDFIDSVDCMIMGRKCMDVISSFNLTPAQWPYGETKIYVLSNSVNEPPENLRGKVEMYSGDIIELINRLEDSGYEHAYIDGGSTITAFINLHLINEITITRAPIILGKGIPLFGELGASIKLVNSEATAFPNHFIQEKYEVKYFG
ncbi:dihydrofolate reductase family protein [Ferrimonas lipolytica]|uniref:Dihydrofolate reductase n=1 Tax=Ferrimonas lipolytica TaxID=2724191 RepID=A0A6H1UH44_9GAMM|nr:dihydrofolate reductase family protein [Ferrimonas lipolytica]QIZ77536.1 dihydrofolate reductase [Ferrimonas lipolytica]